MCINSKLTNTLFTEFKELELHLDSHDVCGVYLDDNAYHPRYVIINKLVICSGVIEIGSDMDKYEPMYGGLPISTYHRWITIVNLSDHQISSIYISTNEGIIKGNLKKGAYPIFFSYLLNK